MQCAQTSAPPPCQAISSCTDAPATTRALFNLGAIRGADVDPEVGHLRRMLAIAVLHQMNRLLAHDTDDVTATTEKTDALTDEHLRIPAANRRDVNESVVVDVLNDETDLIEVAVEHDRR